MPRLTTEQYDGYMQEIMSHYENPEECSQMIDALRSDYNESITATDNMIERARYDDLQEKYNNLSESYRERFFSGGSKDPDPEPESEPEKQYTYQELLKDYI